jgi:hypothetical protein
MSLSMSIVLSARLQKWQPADAGCGFERMPMASTVHVASLIAGPLLFQAREDASKRDFQRIERMKVTGCITRSSAVQRAFVSASHDSARDRATCIEGERYASLRSGRVNENVDPTFGVDVAQISPPCASMIFLQIASPIPVPAISLP